MDDDGRDAILARFLSAAEGDGWAPDTPRVLPGVTTYLVRTFDGVALQFSFPRFVKRDLRSEISSIRPVLTGRRLPSEGGTGG